MRLDEGRSFCLLMEQSRGSWLGRRFLQASLSWASVLLSHWSCFSGVPAYCSAHLIRSSLKDSFWQNAAGWSIFSSEKIERVHYRSQMPTFLYKTTILTLSVSRADKRYCIPFQCVMLLKIGSSQGLLIKVPCFPRNSDQH